jgi:hypothetical protein
MSNGMKKKKLTFALIVLGSGLVAFGLSGWYLATSVLFQLAGADGRMPNSLPDIHAGWTTDNQIEITIGVMLLVCGLLLRSDSK